MDLQVYPNQKESKSFGLKFGKGVSKSLPTGFFFLLAFLKFGIVNGQLYQQTFDTPLSATSNSLLTAAPYCAASPSNTQLSSIGSNGSGCVFEIPSGTGKLTFNRSSDVGTFTRGVDFAPIPVTLKFQFDLKISGNSTAQTNGAKIQIGYNYDPTTYIEDDDVNVHSRIGINWTNVDGEFSLRNGGNTASSANFNGEQRVSLFINKSGSTISYLAPDGSTATLGNEKNDVWVGNSQVFDENNVVTSARWLRRFKFFFNSGSAKIEFDNFLVAPIPAAPSASATQYFCGGSPTVANLVATGTNLNWYNVSTGGSPLPNSTPLSTSTYYVSQTIGGVESHRTAVSAILSTVGISNNVVYTGQTICTGTTPAPFTGDVPIITNGSGIYTFNWEISSSGPSSGFSTISGATSQDYTVPSPLSANRWYRRRITADGCIDYSNVIAIAVNSLISNTITAPQTICNGISSATLNGTPSGGNGLYSFVWEASTTDAFSDFLPISGAESQSYSPGSIGQTTWFRRIVAAGPCPSVTSSAIQITVQPAISNNTIGTDQIICTNTVPNPFLGSIATGGNGTIAYQWEISSTSAVAGFSSISGATTQDYSVPANLTANRWYRRRVNSGACVNAYSNVIQITVNPVIGNNVVSPSTQTICSTNPFATLSGANPVGGGGPGTYSIQWEASTTSSVAGFSPISGANSLNFSPGILSQTTWFRRVVSSPPCSNHISAAVVVNVNFPIAGNNTSGSQTICTGTIPSTLAGSTPTGGTGTFAYLWQVASSLPGTFSTASGTSNQVDYSPSSLSATRWYRRQITSGVCPITFSDTLKITVHPVIGTNTITPTNQTICSTNSSGNLTGSTPTGGGGSGTYAFQWESSTTSAIAGFSAISGATDQSYSPGLLSQTTWFRRVVISPPCANNISPAVLITVTNPIVGNSASGSQTICSNTAPSGLVGSIPTGGNGTSFTYQWQVSTVFPYSFASASGTNNQPNYTVPTLTATRWYRRSVTSGVCPITYSDTIQITVHPVIGTNTISASQTICAGTTPAPFTASTPTGGNGTHTFIWESSTTSSSSGFSPISGATDLTYASVPLVQNTWFRRVVVSPPCANHISNVILVTVQQPLGNNNISEDQSICSGSDPSTFIGTLPSGGTGTYSYLWEYSTSLGGSFVSAGGSSINYSSGSLSANRWFRRRVTSGICPVNYSDTILVSVTPAITTNTISGNQLLCDGAPTSPITGSTPGGGNGSYTIFWEISTTSASTGYSTIPGENGNSYSPGQLSQSSWFRRWVISGACSVTTNVVSITVSPAPTINIGPAIPQIPQGGTTIGLGGSFGGSATGAIWSTPLGGVFFNNTGLNPGITTYTASGSAPEFIPITLTSVGGACGTVSDTKVIQVIPDTNGISGSPNVYVKVVGPALIPIGALTLTLETGGGAKFQPGDRAILIQMKGAQSSNSTASDASYGSIFGLGSSGNYEIVTVGSLSGDVLTLQRCTKKIYSTGFKVQLVKIAKYTGNKNIVESSKVSTVQMTRKGMGYVPNSIITGITVDNSGTFGSGLVVAAKADALGQISDINIVDAGSGYVFAPKIIFPNPTVAPYDKAGYKARAKALLNFSAKQWNGEVGGILAIEVDGNLNLGSNIEMTGMGLAGGMFGEKVGAIDCSVVPAYNLDFFTGFGSAGQRGEGLNVLSTSASQRGRGKNTTGGGGGFDADAGGGGGANWNDGGRGGSSSYTFLPCTQFPCDRDFVKGGIGGTADGAPNGIRARAYNYNPDKNRVFLGGGGGGGHSLSDFLGEQEDGAGGYGGGLIFIMCDTLKSNGFEVRAEGMPGENVTTGGGAGGGGGGGAIMMNINAFKDAFYGRVNGGNGGNTQATECAFINDLSTYRFYGAGGGGGGGVVWFKQNASETNLLAQNSNLTQSQRGTNQEGFYNSALKGGVSRDQDSYFPIENLPYLGSVFTVGGTSPTPNFPNLQAAASWLAFKGSDASEITLLVKENTSLPTKIYDYQQPVTFSRIFTPGCTYGDATIVVKPWTTPNSVNFRWPDASQYIQLDGIPSVTFKDVTISSDSPEIPYMIEVENGSKLILENTNVIGGITLKTGSSNILDLKNTVHGGSITLESGQVANLLSTTTINGSNSLNKQFIFNSGSEINMPAGTILDLNGASITNHGGTFNIDPNAEIRLSGNFVAQAIGGTEPTSFDKLNITSNGIIAINTPTTVREWNQTGSATINHNTRTLTVTEKLIPGSGGFIGSGSGKVILQNGTQPVEASGFFANLEINGAGGVIATNPITLSQNLTLTNGKLNMGNHLLTVNGSGPSAISNTPSSWIIGSLKQRVVAGNTYNLPIGTGSQLERAQIGINSLVGLQHITINFVAQNPNLHPLISSFIPQTEGLASYSTNISNGYWSINPNAGSANYDLSIFPSFASGFAFYTIYKRATGGNEWDLFGSLSNPENTPTYIQSDGSIRRLGFNGFSDFAIGVSEEPLPLSFLDFRATKRNNGIKLNWKMGECLTNGRFLIKRATQTSDFNTAKVLEVKEDGNCQTEFESLDSDPLSASRVYYQIEATARNEKTIVSPVRVVQVMDVRSENPFLSPIKGDSKQYELVGESVASDGINVFSMDGKAVGTNLKAENKILDLHSYPSGVYMVEMVNSGWKVRQKIVVGY